MEKIDIPFWKNENGSGYKSGKPVEINGVKFWASMYQNEPKTERTPLFKVVLKPVDEPRGAVTTTQMKPATENYDDIPF